MTTLFLSAMLAVATSKQAPANPIAGSDDKRIYTVATAHLDTQWLWTIQDTIKQHLPKTFNTNFGYFKEFPDYNFNFEGAFHYMLIKEYYPEAFEKIRAAVKEGRWNVAGSWVDAVDTNIPSPESLIRQTLYGNGFWKKEFGKRSVDVYLPDCFGFGYALPSIENHCGLIGFSTQKLTWGSSIGIPFPVGVWEGVDGTSVIAALDAKSYTSTLKKDFQKGKELLDQVNETGDKSGAYVAYRYHGTGDTGGGPKRESIVNLERAIQAGGSPKVLSAPADQMYKDITPAQEAKLPRYKGEILMTAHGTGCYTSQVAMKRWNRKNELLADAAERSSVVAHWLGGSTYPQQKLNDAWVRFLWHQFHDDLTGTSIPEVYGFSWNDEVLSLNQFSEITKRSGEVIASQMETEGDGTPVVVYNPVGFSRTSLVRVPLPPALTGSALVARDAKGNLQPCQIDATSAEPTVVFRATAPANGAVVYHLAQIHTASTPAVSASEQGLENDHYKVTLDANGDISSVFDKVLGKELLQAPVRLQLLNNLSAAWPAWEVTYDAVSAAPRGYVSGTPTITMIEQGPARGSVRVKREQDGSTFVQTISLAAGSDRVEIANDIDWNTKDTLLKAAFSFTASNPLATYDIGLGTIQRGNNVAKKYEVPAQTWADITAPDASYGVSVLSESKYGWDKPNDNTLRLTLIHTPEPKGHDAFQATNDLGKHHFVYAIAGHSGDWTHQTANQAASLNQPLVGFITTPHEGSLGTSFSFASLDDSGVKITAIKKAEDSDEVVVRLFEADGKTHPSVKLSFGTDISGAREVNGQEDSVKGGSKVPRDHNSIVFSLKPYQPRAFAIKLHKAPHHAAKLGAKTLALPYNLNVVTTKDGLKTASFDGEGHSLAAELLPTNLTVEDVPFKLGTKSKLNALTPSGQTLSIPAGTSEVVFLAASAGADVDAAFVSGGQTIQARIPSYSERVAQWTNRIVNGKVQESPASFGAPYLKSTPIGWIGTHRHDEKGDEAYVPTYLFKISVMVPKGATSITLPNSPTVRIMAATAVTDPLPSVLTLPLYD